MLAGPFGRRIKKMKEIIEKIEMLRIKDKDMNIFGASSHEYKFNKKIKEKEIIKFEKKHNVHLPEDYKIFLVEIGNGGAGPFYGILPLEMGLFCDIDNPNKKYITNPSKPFLLSEAWNMEYTGDYEDESALDKFEEKYYSNELLNGTIRICNFGCGHFINLVINGSEFSHIWSDDRGSNEGIFPFKYYTNGKDRMTFYEWYKCWLDQAIENFS
jgi:hypothetical protein